MSIIYFANVLPVRIVLSSHYAQKSKATGYPCYDQVNGNVTIK